MSDHDGNRSWANNLMQFLEEADEDAIMTHFQELEDKLKVPSGINNMYNKALTLFNIDDINLIDIDIIETEKSKVLWEVTGVQTKFIKFYDINDEDYKIRWEKIFENLYYLDRFIRTTYLLSRMSQDNYEYSLNEDTDGLFKFTPVDVTKNTPYQNLLLFIFGKINELEYSKYQDSVYKKVMVNGNFTHSWKKVTTIKSFIMQMCNMKTNYEQWKNSTHGGNNNIKSAEQYIIDYSGPEIKTLCKDRHVHAFSNGIYISKVNIGTEKEKVWADKFIPYGQASEYVTVDTVASKYFDKEFNNYDHLAPEDFFEIMKDCPVFKSILDYQKFPKDAQRWLVIFIARNLFDVNEIERWHVIMYLLGIAGSGKSTIIEKIISKFYDSDDVKMLSNNIEKKFGLKPLASAKIVAGSEIQGDCALEQTEWQLIAEGGTITPAEKNKNAETITWMPPVPMAGNSVPEYNNQCGQQSRRMVIWKFWRKVVDTNTNLEEELADEIPKIIKMGVMGYHWAVNKYQKKGIWKILPKYFQENQEEMDENSNTLLNFLKSDKIVLSEKVYVPEKIFKQAFNEHCKENNLPKSQFNVNFYSVPFSNNNITVAKRSRKKYPANSDNYMQCTFFIGVDIVNVNNQEDDAPEIPG
jgi:phage/plasmid-associated DNA primase